MGDEYFCKPLYMYRHSYYFARLLLNDFFKSQLLDPDLVQESDDEGRSKAKNTQQQACKSKACVLIYACLLSVRASVVDLPPQSVHCRPYACSKI